MKLKLNDMQLKVSPFLLLVFIIAILIGCINELLWAVCALLFHEGGHVWAANLSNEPIESLELLPFGAVIRLYERPQSIAREFFIAAAGPAASLMSATVAAGLVSFFPTLALSFNGFVSASLMLAAVNLLPAMPLDGGRMLRSLLHNVVSTRTAAAICAVLGLVLSVALIGLGIYGTIHDSFLPIPFLLALFLIQGGINELRNGTYAAVAAITRRAGRLNSRDSLRMQTVAILSNVKARDALKRLKGASLIAVMDGSMHLLGTLSEGDLMQQMVKKGADITLGAIVRGRD